MDAGSVVRLATTFRESTPDGAPLWAIATAVAVFLTVALLFVALASDDRK
jgi:hypothetical protein